VVLVVVLRALGLGSRVWEFGGPIDFSSNSMGGCFGSSQVGLVGVAIKQRPWLVVLELCQYGDLSDVLHACDQKKVALTLHELLRFGPALPLPAYPALPLPASPALPLPASPALPLPAYPALLLPFTTLIALPCSPLLTTACRCRSRRAWSTSTAAASCTWTLPHATASSTPAAS
jgi:hypothetical protein